MNYLLKVSIYVYNNTLMTSTRLHCKSPINLQHTNSIIYVYMGRGYSLKLLSFILETRLIANSCCCFDVALNMRMASLNIFSLYRVE